MIPPIERSVSVSWDPKTAFERFTAQFGSWWPKATLSIGGERIKQIVFEPREGGLIYEEHLDGRRFQWGQVLEWDPPNRVKFTWHPSRDAAGAQEVEVTFLAEPSGTLVKLTSTGWEKWGPGAEKARKGYGSGWNYVLNTWAGRKTAPMFMMRSMIGIMTFFQKLKGGRDSIIAKAEGEIIT